MDAAVVEQRERLAVGVAIGVDGTDAFEGQQGDDTCRLEFAGLGQDDDLIGAVGHGAGRFGTHDVVGHEAVLIEPVCANEEFVDRKIPDTGLDHRADHDLRLMLIFAAQKDDMGIGLFADIVGDESRVGDDGDITAVGGQLFGKQCAAAAGLDHDRLAVVDALSGPLGNLAFALIVEGEMVGDVIAGRHGRIAVLAAQQTFALKEIEIFADGHFGDIQCLRKLRDSNAFLLVYKIE